MSTVNSNIQIGKKDAAFFAANPTLVLLDGQLIYNEDTGDLFIGDGVTQLSALVAINGGSISLNPEEVVITDASGNLDTLLLGASQSIRRNAANNAFEAYTGLTSSDIGVTVQAYNANTTLLGNSTTGSGNIVLATSPAFTGRPSFVENNGIVHIGSIAAGYSTIWLGQASPSASNYNILMAGSTALTLQASSSVTLSAALGTFFVNVTSAGLMTFSNGLNMVFNTANGTKIGTATGQKIGFWNATPIVQPTTAVAAATFVANAGTAVNDASTFDGYTMGQVVRALRNAGLLA